MGKTSKDMGKLSRKPRRLQWGRRPNTFSCGYCKKLFRVRRALKGHKTVCMRDFGRVKGLLRELKLRIGPKPPGRIRKPLEMSWQEWNDFVDKTRMERRLKHTRGRRPNLHHVCEKCGEEYISAGAKRDHKKYCKTPKVITC